MNIFKTGEKLNVGAENGIWVDYKEHHWLFMIKDTIWDTEELQRLKHGEIKISFIQKGIVDAFLLEIFDCLETSDIPFCIKDGDEGLIASLKDKKDYICDIYAVNEHNIILGCSQIILTHQNSTVLKQKLNQRFFQDYDSDAFDMAYQKLVQRYEPYELEQFQVFYQKNRG